MHPAAARIRARLAALPSATRADGSALRWMGEGDATIRRARLLDATALAHHPVGPAAPFPDPVAFLDGTQQLDIAAYLGTLPIGIATVRAAVRERVGGILRTVVREEALYAVGRPSVLAAAGAALMGAEGLEIREGAPHPLEDIAEIRRAVDRVRGNLELRAAERFRAGNEGWLIVDGSLGGSSALAGDSRAVGIVRSHAALPFDGADLEAYLQLPAAHRTSLFEPTPGFRPLVAWGLRLWPWEERDLFHGLVRVEVAPPNGGAQQADEISRALLAERLPMTGGPDGDRLLYGTHSVRQYLRAE